MRSACISRSFNRTLLPLPVEPPSRIWGIFVRLTVTGPVRLSPRTNTKLSGDRYLSFQGSRAGKSLSAGAE